MSTGIETKGRTGAILAGIAALALCGAPAAAVGKGGAKLKAAKANGLASGAFDIASATATCPKGTRVVSGGYSSSRPTIPSNWLNVFESQRVGAGKWRVSGVESYNATDRLTAFAYCQAFKGKIKTRSARVGLPTLANQGTVAQAVCPPGTKAISGGFSTEAATATDSVLVTRSIAAFGNRWVVDATRLAGSAARSIVAHVYCADARVRSRTADVAVMGPAGAARTATTPKCPKRTSARGGGFATSAPVGGLANAALVYETRRAGSAWSSSAAAGSATTSITLQTGAYCR